jgi:ATP-binding cassette subfamily C protein CydD
LAAVVLDSFRGLRTLQSIGAVERRRVQLAAAAARLNTTTMVVVRRAFISGSVMEVVITFSIAANATFIGLSLLGYVRVDAAPQVTLFSGLLTLLLCPMYFAPLRGMAAAYHSRERAAAAVPTIMALLADTGPQPVERPAAPVAGPVTVVLDEVGFSFGGSSSPVIQDVNLTIRPGQWTAITGASGAGKTTLLSLIAGAREPTTGSVEWRTPAGELAPQLGGCAWIGQQTAILPGSITDNICIGRPAASPADIAGALAAAGLADVVARLPDGLDTQLGEGGSGLSTGEARRIAIARAFLRDAELWVLDEPTAHLDPEAEARVIDALRAATPGRTVIVATHSVALAGCADTLLTVADASVQPVRDVIAA